MLDTIDLFGYTVEIDKDLTKDAFAHFPPGWGCTCTYCRNFRAGIPLLPAALTAPIQRCGIDLMHPAEIVEYYGDQMHLYEAWYHVVGRICAMPAAPPNSFGHYQLTETIQIRITDKIALLPKHFPTPVFQIGFFATLPWVLNEPPER